MKAAQETTAAAMTTCRRFRRIVEMCHDLVEEELLIVEVHLIVSRLVPDLTYQELRQAMATVLIEREGRSATRCAHRSAWRAMAGTAPTPRPKASSPPRCACPVPCARRSTRASRNTPSRGRTARAAKRRSPKILRAVARARGSARTFARDPSSNVVRTMTLSGTRRPASPRSASSGA